MLGNVYFFMGMDRKKKSVILKYIYFIFMIKTINKKFTILLYTFFFVIYYWSGPQKRIQSKNFVITAMWQYLFEKLPSYMELSNDNSNRE